MAARSLVALLIVVLLLSGLGVYFLYIRSLGPIGVTVAGLLSDPGRYDGRQVRVEGFLRKSWFLNQLVHNLSDGSAGVAVTGSDGLDLDAYVGLGIVVEGRAEYRPQILGAPSLRVVASSVHAKEGSPHFFLQWEESGGPAGMHQVFMIDNNSTAFFLSRGQTLWEDAIGQTELQRAAKLAAENGFFSVPSDRYEARPGAMGYVTYSLKFVHASDSGLETKAVTWVDEWAAREALPSNLTRLQGELRAFAARLLPPPYGGTLLDVSVDRSSIVVGEYVAATLKVTNVASENQTFEVSLPVFDLLLFDENGTLRAKWSEGQAFPELVFLKTLSPGESYEEELLWNLYGFENATWSFKPLSPGTYYLQGVLRSTPQLQAARVRVEVRPRL